MQQQAVTITTQGTELRLITPPQHDQPSHLPDPGLPDEEEDPAATLQTSPSRTREGGHSGSQASRKGRNKLRKIPQQQLRQDTSPEPPTEAPPENHQAPQQPTGSPNLPAPLLPPVPEQKPAHIGPRIFHYSRCTGRKKAVCIGINYTGSGKELNGCVNDARSIRKFLIKNWKFSSRDILVLTDDNQDPRRRPTKANMLNAMKWLVKDAKAHDSLFFHYSGHGGQIRSSNSDESHGYDDVIFPVDHEQKGIGIITDDTMNKLMVRTIPDGCRLTALFDSCHSGSALDLVYVYHSNGSLRSSPVSPRYRKMKSSAGDVICFSGCEDTQTSADTVEGGLAVGAMSYAFVKCLNAKPRQSYQQLLKGVRALLRKHFSQRPQLSTSHKTDLRKRFIL